MNLVPVGLSPETHLQVAIQTNNPLEQESTLSDDMDFAARMIVSWGDKIHEWRTKQWETILQAVNSEGVTSYYP